MTSTLLAPAVAKRTYVATMMPSLHANHLADLRKSGLSDETIAKAGFYTETDPQRVADGLNWKQSEGASKLGPCLAIPFFDIHGDRLLDYIRFKPTTPRLPAKKGHKPSKNKPIKYESPRGLKNRVYFPPGIGVDLLDETKPIFITEGEKKASKAWQEGIPCIGLVGVYGWQKRRARDSQGKPVGPRELITDLESISWHLRTVYICFDSDTAVKPSVLKAERHLIELLESYRAHVRIVRLPHGEGTNEDGTPRKQGLDDYLVSNSVDQFWDLVNIAGPVGRLANEVIEADDDPDRLARIYLEKHSWSGKGTLWHWRGSFHQWNGQVYRPVPNDEVRAEIHREIKAEFDRLNKDAIAAWECEGNTQKSVPTARKVLPALLNAVLDAVLSKVLIPRETSSPTWLNAPEKKTNNFLAFTNGILNLDDLFAYKDVELRPHDPCWFSQTVFPYPFNLNADCPKWQARFQQLGWPFGA